MTNQNSSLFFPKGVETHFPCLYKMDQTHNNKRVDEKSFFYFFHEYSSLSSVLRFEKYIYNERRKSIIGW